MADRVRWGLAVLCCFAGVGYGGPKPVAPKPVTIVLLDANPDQSGCPSDRTYRTAGHKVRPEADAAECAIDVATFAEGRAPSLQAERDWLEGHDLEVDEGSDPLELPVHAVIVYDPAVPGAVEATEQEVHAELLKAFDLFDRHRLGIVPILQATTAVPLGDSRADLVKAGCGAVAGSSDLFSPGVVTVVYADPASWGFDGGGWTFFGYNCRAHGYRNLIFIAQDHADATLAHELGHAFWLNHVRAREKHNLMRCCVFAPDGAPVDRLSLGQAYRTVFGAESWLNAGGLRTGVTRPCQGNPISEDYASDWPCPSLLLDWP